MDEYLQHMPSKPDRISLSALENHGSYTNIPYAFFYENVDRSPDFMPTPLLKESLARALQAFPVLTGVVRLPARGKLHIEIDPQHLNTPRFKESFDEKIAFQDVRDAGFAWSAWPANLVTVGGGFAAPDPETGDIVLLHVHVVRLKQNTGVALFTNIPHYAVDGYGYFAFLNHWASTMRAMKLSKSQPPPEGDFCHDRSCIYKYLPKEKTPIDALSQSIYTTSNMFCDTLALLSPPLLGRLLTKLGSLSSGKGHLFHVSQGTLEKLRSEVKSHLPAGTVISANDVLCAMIMRAYCQSQPLPEPKAGWFSAAPAPESHFTVRMPCDVRPRLGMTEKFTGNVILPIFIRQPMDEVLQPTTPETLARSALHVREATNSISPSLVAGFYDTFSQHPTCHMRPLSFAASHTKTSMITTSHTRFELYDVDFGSGRPKFACLTPLFAGSYTMAAFLPPPPGVDGAYVLLTSNVEAMGNIVQNEFWKENTELLW
ncbi:hypothetical protein DL767_002692 [Monosporascus sp. MG133]|nr:hypothetical protein DL767_002692 [Monosporascus sp. MG133]